MTTVANGLTRAAGTVLSSEVERHWIGLGRWEFMLVTRFADGLCVIERLADAYERAGHGRAGDRPRVPTTWIPRWNPPSMRIPGAGGGG